MMGKESDDQWFLKSEALRAEGTSNLSRARGKGVTMRNATMRDLEYNYALPKPDLREC